MNNNLVSGSPIEVNLNQAIENEKIIQVKNFTKVYKNKFKAVNDISFDIYGQQFHVFIGANGSGKTTTIKAIINAYVNWSGTILINGIPNSKVDAKKTIGYMPEKDIFPNHFSIEKFLFSLAILSGWTKQDAKRQVNHLINFLNLNQFTKRNPNNLSSGQKRKVLLAQALINNPKILIMDEPTTNLDPVARKELFEILHHLKTEGTTIFISTHDLYEVSRFTDYVTIINKGKIVYDGKKHLDNLEQLYFQYVNYEESKNEI
ncbi:ABC transporter ATP-binding protein [[Mycoplasma] testudinis]|uniref:ABC transporter ATP-binding protein n=1 Tax=[Mycoplasma] testudinis TaxID=33924 RepID=UPI000A6100E9|nr:ABC transporter ATP-binding protein [[Mycoplasma] testudinis]